jgi:hypothetical protein
MVDEARIFCRALCEDGGGPVAPPGRAEQVDSIKPTVKALGTERLKLEYDEPPSNFAFKFNLRCTTR